MATIEEIQARVDGCKTNRQRRRRLKELAQLAKAQGGLVCQDDAIEGASLFFSLRLGNPVPVEWVVEQMKEAYASGKLTRYSVH